MGSPLSRVKAGEVIASVRTRLQDFTEERFPKKEILKLINECQDELQEMSGTKEEPQYRDSVIIPMSKRVDSLGGTGASYTNSTKRVIIPLSGTGITWNGDADGFDASWVGAVVTIWIGTNTSSSTELPNSPDSLSPGGQRYNTVVKSYVNSTTLELESTGYTLPATDLSGGSFNVTIQLIDNAVDSVDLAQLSNFTRIDRITSIESSLAGICIEKDEKQFKALKRYSADESPYVDDIIWMRQGDIIYFCKGANLSSYGTRILNHIRLPLKCANYNSYVDTKETMIPMLKEMILVRIFASLKLSIPPEFSATAQKLGLMKKAVEEEKVKVNQQN